MVWFTVAKTSEHCVACYCVGFPSVSRRCVGLIDDRLTFSAKELMDLGINSTAIHGISCDSLFTALDLRTSKPWLAKSVFLPRLMAQWRSDVEHVAANLKNFHCFEIYQERRQGQDAAGVWRPDHCRQRHVLHGEARDLFQVGGYPAPGVAISPLAFVTVLLTLTTVSLVEHEHARQDETGILELLKVPGMVSCLTLIMSPMIAFSFLGSTLQTHVEGAPFNLYSSGVSRVFSCSTVEHFVSDPVIGHISKGHGGGVTGLLCTLYLV